MIGEEDWRGLDLLHRLHATSHHHGGLVRGGVEAVEEIEHAKDIEGLEEEIEA